MCNTFNKSELEKEIIKAYKGIEALSSQDMSKVIQYQDLHFRAGAIQIEPDLIEKYLNYHNAVKALHNCYEGAL